MAGRIDGPVPHYPAPDGVKLAAGWLVERAGFGKGYPDDDGGPLPVVHQARAGADQPRRRHAPQDVIALARSIRDGVRDVFGITLEPEPVLLGCAL